VRGEEVQKEWAPDGAVDWLLLKRRELGGGFPSDSLLAGIGMESGL